MRTTLATLALLAFWFVIVPPEGWGDVVVGAIASLTLALWAVRSLWPPTAGPLGLHPLRVIPFLALLLWRIVHAAVGVLRIVFDPQLPIDPQLIRQTVRLPNEAARVGYANSISITPGTLTVDLDDDGVTVHALAPELASELLDGSLAREIGGLFAARGGDGA